MESEFEQHTFKKAGSSINLEGEAIKQPLKKKKGGKILFVIILLLISASIALGFVFKDKIKTLIKGEIKPTPAPVVLQTPQPTPNPLVRSDWSLEILNGSGVSGLAKKIADKLQDLGYPIIKTGNADKSNYQKTQVLVKKNLAGRLDLVIADIKDIVKISTVSGELTEGTASARIILGKE